MVTQERGFIVVTAIVSTLASLLCILSVATNNWLTATAVLTTRLQNNINYGLFAGQLERQQLASKLPFKLMVVCDFNLGVCLYSCQRDAAVRHNELERILAGSPLAPCDQAQPRWTRSFNDTSEDKAYAIKADKKSDLSAAGACMPAVWWLCTVLCLSLAIVFTLCGVAFAIHNLHTNPVEQIFNIFGLYIWNGCAAGFALLALILWGALFHRQLQHNVAITDTLRTELTFSSAGHARISYSFYLLLAAVVLTSLNVCTLMLRRRRIQHLAAPSCITIEQNDVQLQFY